MIKLIPLDNPELFKWTECLHKPPSHLYAKGDVTLLESRPKVAIIGSRTMTNYGRAMISQIVPGLVHAGCTIVSGGAMGVDVESQRKALEYEGKVITILGNGLNNPAPKTNQPFFWRVEQRGLLLSEFEPDQPAGKYTFPQRNRLISAMSDLVLIVEARKKSGALITADFAAAHGKPVACIPGRASDEMSYGCNELIKQGAHMVTTVTEIITLLNIQLSPKQLKLIDLYS